MIKINNLNGIVYDYIKGENLLDLTLNNLDIDFATDKLVEIQTQFHKQRTECFESYKDFLLQFCDNNESRKLLYDLDDDNYLCHGDLHLGNVLIMGEKAIAIDFMNVCRGPREYDIARSYYLMTEGDIPENYPNRDKVIEFRKILGNLYLLKMGYTFDKIKKYFKVIDILRKKEIE